MTNRYDVDGPIPLPSHPVREERVEVEPIVEVDLHTLLREACVEDAELRELLRIPEVRRTLRKLR